MDTNKKRNPYIKAQQVDFNPIIDLSNGLSYAKMETGLTRSELPIPGRMSADYSKFSSKDVVERKPSTRGSWGRGEVEYAKGFQIPSNQSI